MRRLDIEDILGYVPTPDISDGHYLTSILFKVGPSSHESPVSYMELESWQRQHGIELAPWQVDLIIDMSKAYLSETYAARHIGALCPWPLGVKVWMHVTTKKYEQSKSKEPKEPQHNGSRKRHRNPPTG